MFDDHIVVESPGKLPGLVSADNIRFTHFSRNPKIAEFLKNYNATYQLEEVFHTDYRSCDLRNTVIMYKFNEKRK